MQYLKVKEHKNLVRDSNSKAIINKDSEALNKYREERELRLKLSNIANEYDTLKNEVSDMKDMLKTLLERTSK